MDFITDYCQQLVALVAVGAALFKVKFDVDILKAKVQTLFDLWNQRNNTIK